jgi:hypothetical protein
MTIQPKVRRDSGMVGPCGRSNLPPWSSSLGGATCPTGNVVEHGDRPVTTTDDEVECARTDPYMLTAPVTAGLIAVARPSGIRVACWCQPQWMGAVASPRTSAGNPAVAHGTTGRVQLDCGRHRNNRRNRWRGDVGRDSPSGGSAPARQPAIAWRFVLHVGLHPDSLRLSRLFRINRHSRWAPGVDATSHDKTGLRKMMRPETDARW